MNNKKIRIFHIELQIALKLYLRGKKDIENAKHLYEFFKEGLYIHKMDDFLKMLIVEKVARRYLKWNFQK